MNWYKKAIYDIFDWDKTFKELKEKYGKDPESQEVQDEMTKKVERFDEKPEKKKELITI
jgi:hypothetical protein